MAKIRVRLKSGRKARRWAKGRSSESNPPSSRHRDQARGRFFEPLARPAALTTDRLKQHDAVLALSSLSVDSLQAGHGAGTNSNNSNDVGGENESVTTLTNTLGRCSFYTFASELVTDSAVPLDRVLASLRHDSPLYRETLAVLAAVGETVQEMSGGGEAVPEMSEGGEAVTEMSEGGEHQERRIGETFSVLVTLLEASVDRKHAISYLLSVYIRHVPRRLLVRQFGECCRVFIAAIQSASDSDTVAASALLQTRCMLECLVFMLKAQPVSVWSQSLPGDVFNTLLQYVVHAKPKLRRVAQKGVVSVLMDSRAVGDDTTVVHPAASHVAQFCVATVEENGIAGHNLPILHVIQLLSRVLSTLSLKDTKRCVEMLLKLLSMPSPQMRVSCLKALSTFLQKRPDTSTFPAVTCARLVSSLYDFQPAINDAELLPLWLRTMHHALAHLFIVDAALLSSHLATFFACAVKLWTSNRQPVRAAVTETLTRLLDHVVRNSGEEAAAAVEQCYNSVLLGLKYQSIDAWSGVLTTLTNFFIVYGARGRAFMGATLKSLVELKDVEGFGYEAELETAIAAAVTNMGPRSLVENVPLELSVGQSEDTQFKRSWLLPVMRNSIKNTELAYFIDYFLPLSQSMKKTSKMYEKSKKHHLSKIYSTIEQQLWDLLPGFCTGATDVADCFQRLAKTLGAYLTERSELRLTVMTSLRNLIVHSCSGEDARATVSRFAKNFLPILFNLYTNFSSVGADSGQRNAAFQTISTYIVITDGSLVETLVNRCLQKLNEGTVSGQERACIFDLLKVMLASVDHTQLEQMWTCIKVCIASENTFSQKASYRLLEEMCKLDNCSEFVQTIESQAIDLLNKALSTVTSSAKPQRLNCVSSLLDHLAPERERFVVHLLPEAVLCCKEQNDKTRVAAFALIGKIGQTLQRWHASGDDNDESDAASTQALRRYVELLLAGLTGSPHMMAATNLALARVVHVFREILPDDLVEMIVENTCVIMATASREPVECCFSLIKSMVFALPLANFARFLPKVLQAVTTMTDDCKRHFRLKIRDFLVLLVRKFGFDVVSSVAPKNDAVLAKRLKNIKKLKIRKEKSREAKRSLGSRSDLGGSSMSIYKTKSVQEILGSFDVSDGDSDNDEDQTANQPGQTWIKEDAEGIVDLLDPSASQQITSTRPNLKADKSKRKPSSGFKFTDDNRLIVCGEDGPDNDNDDDGESDQDGDNSDFIESISMARGKRKLANESVSGRSMAGSSRGRPVTSGIFRQNASSDSGAGNPRKKRKADTPGQEYASKKGHGDMKRSGKLEPYAYVPLARSSLNKRKQAKYKGQFKSLVRGAKKGSARGRKLRAKKDKK